MSATIDPSTINVTHIKARQKPRDVPETAIAATPFKWIDPSHIEPRKWLYGTFLIRGHVSLTIAPGGAGKSSLGIVEALALATGRNLLGQPVYDRTNTWIWNGEDPLDELMRRTIAACIQHGINQSDLDGHLFLDSGLNMPICIAKQSKDGIEICEKTVAEIIDNIRKNNIGLVVIDPLISTHQVSENDNGAVDAMVKAWTRIASKTGASIHLVHHSRKSTGETQIEDARGAVSLIAAARAARTLNPMSQDEAEKAGVPDSRFRYVRVQDGKANLAVRSDKAIWFKMASVDLQNGGVMDGDSVGVPIPWTWPDPFEEITVDDLITAQNVIGEGGPWRESAQAKAWAGIPIAGALDLDVTDKFNKAKVKAMLERWIKNKAFKVVKGFDEKRNERTFIEVGERASK